MTPRDYALLAREAYSASPDIGQSDSASRAIIRETSSGLCVAFPGTNNLPCIGADFDIFSTDVPGVGDVHRGFWNAWDSISVQVLAAINGKPVTLVGHSLGAAIAIMAAVTMTLSDNPPVAVYGFEPPRVSSRVNVAVLLANVPVYLYKNGNDIVPDLPLNWHHAASLRQIGHPSLPIPNVEDHAITRVITALG